MDAWWERVSAATPVTYQPHKAQSNFTEKSGIVRGYAVIFSVIISKDLKKIKSKTPAWKDLSDLPGYKHWHVIQRTSQTVFTFTWRKEHHSIRGGDSGSDRLPFDKQVFKLKWPLSLKKKSSLKHDFCVNKRPRKSFYWKMVKHYRWIYFKEATLRLVGEVPAQFCSCWTHEVIY